jgi:hypothetical protein
MYIQCHTIVQVFIGENWFCENTWPIMTKVISQNLTESIFLLRIIVYFAKIHIFLGIIKLFFF